MNRVEAAIQEGRCVIAVGGRALENPDVLIELRRRSAMPSVALGSDPVTPVKALDADALRPATDVAGGVLVLVEPEGGMDGSALGELDRLIKASKNKPRLVVAARAYNPFSMPMGMRLMKTQLIKQRAQDFLGRLPVPQLVAVAAAAPAPVEADRHRAPRPELVNREEERARLAELLTLPGGPIVVAGPAGVGKRWLVDSVLADFKLDEGDLVRLPDITFARGVSANTVLTVLAIAATQAGDGRLHLALTAKEQPVPVDLAALVLELLQSDVFAGKLLVLRHFERLLDRRDGSLYREGRLELILRALLTAPLALRLVITSEQQPELHAEGLSVHIRRLNLRGLPGKDLHALFDLWHAPEFPREHFGTIAERVHGHPIAARTIAIDARDTPIEELIEQPRYLRASKLGDFDTLGRNLRKRVEKLSVPQRLALAGIVLFRDGAGPEELTLLGINRATRLDLLARGLLEQTPVNKGRRYYVHPLVAQHIDQRTIEDFDRMELVGTHLLARSRELRKEGDDAGSIGAAIEGNRLLGSARRSGSTVRLPYPDMDGTIDDIRGMMRRKRARLDIARMRINECLKAAPTMSELLVANAELLAAERAGADTVQAAYTRAAQLAPTPEVFHQEASWHLARNNRGKAVDALTRGCAAFPGNARMRRRLAALLISLHKLDEAAVILREALDLEPMMADTYSLLGEVYVSLGRGHWEQAAQVLSEGLDLGHKGPQHMLRHAMLLHARGCAEPDARDTLWEQAETEVRNAWQADQGDIRAAVLLAAVTLDRVEALDATRLDQVEYVLRQTMKKRKETAEVLVQRARVLVHREAWRAAEELLDRALSQASGLAAAFMARGELWEARHQPFHAFEAWKAARTRTQPDTAQRFITDLHVARLQTLIESGMAAQMMSEKGIELAADPGNAGQSPRQQRVKRRRKGQAEVDVEVDASAEASAPEEAVAVEAVAVEAVAAEAVAVEAVAVEAVAVEAAPVEAAPEAPVEAAPVEAAPEAAVEAPPAE